MVCLASRRSDLSWFWEPRRGLICSSSERPERRSADPMNCFVCGVRHPPDRLKTLLNTGLCRQQKGVWQASVSVVNKFVRCDSLDRYSVLFNVAVPKVLEHINDCNNSLLNSDLRKWVITMKKYNANNERTKRKYLIFWRISLWCVIRFLKAF